MDTANGFEWTALHFASHAGNVACVRALIAAGADVNRARRRNECTPFSRALYNGYRRVLKILLHAGADVHTGYADRTDRSIDAWALVDAIRKVGDWPNYVRRRRATVASVVKKAITRNFLPDAINLEIAAFIEPPGGYSLPKTLSWRLAGGDPRGVDSDVVRKGVGATCTTGGNWTTRAASPSPSGQPGLVRS